MRMDDLIALLDAVNRNAAEEVSAILQSNPQLVHQRDAEGATALHYAAFEGHSDVARVFIQAGADINARDDKFGATPAGWAIEYLRELGGLLGIELADFAFALERGDAVWVSRFLARFPALRDAHDAQGRPFRQLAAASGNAEIVRLFQPSESTEGRSIRD
jgi:ankyrin repeat protein